MTSLIAHLRAGLRAAAIPPAATLAVACSGGPDSLALTLALAELAPSYPFRLMAFTVDHGLRPESATEARQVGAWLTPRSIPHHILRWDGSKPAANLQEAARDARYALLTEACEKAGTAALLLGHHAEDQAETFLLRLARGSGVDGLSAMRPDSVRDGIRLLRPCLDLPKADLRAYLDAADHPFLTDPSNANPAFDRVRIRALLPLLDAAGLTPARINLAARNCARARASLEAETDRCVSTHLVHYPDGWAHMRGLPDNEEITLRLLARLLTTVAGARRPPRLEDLLRFRAALRTPGFRGQALHGVLCYPYQSGWLFAREPAAITETLHIAPGETRLWDGRFAVTLEEAPLPLLLGPLGESGWRSLTLRRPKPLPRAVLLYSLPALRDAEGRIHAVPSLNYRRDDVRAYLTRQKTPCPPSL